MRERAQRRRRRRPAAASLILAAAAASGVLAACSGPASDELVWYINPDTGGQAAIAKRCSTDEYTIKVQELPQAADQQRIQLARRLAAGDPAIDLMSLDPPFTAEFADAGYLADLPEDLVTKLRAQSLKGSVTAATWNGKLVVAPFWTNTQILWYRKSFAKKAGLNMTKPVTWDQIIQAADKNGGRVGVQANKYEGYAIWINALIAGAGGTLLTNAEKGADATITIDSPAGKAAAKVIQTLAHSKAAQPDLSVSQEGQVLAPFQSDRGAFQVNWTFVYGTYAGSPTAKDLGWAMYPRTEADKPARPPLGGIGIGVNSHSEKVGKAMKAVACITSPENQGIYASTDGNMPASAEGYKQPELTKKYPADLLALFQESVNAAAPRPATPYWSDVSSAIQSSWHPPSAVNEGTPAKSQKFIEDVLQGRRLL
ncbi:MAG: extracellular solute-binding protein [Thermoleophilia bacterium]|nr:extracellular solute-binding protein [Thermoleophilia bacterium]